jgi:hypothetical protein
MKRTDYILFLTTHLLTLPEELFQKVFADLEINFEVHELQKPDRVSLGGRDEQETEKSFATWILEMRQSKVHQVRVYWEPANAGLPSHIANAFAGQEELLLEITTNSGVQTFYLESSYSSAYNIQPEDFQKLIDHQQNSELLWNRIGDLIQEANEMNLRPPIDRHDVRRYITERKDNFPFDMMVAQLIQEVQIECLISGAPLEIPEHLKTLLYKPENSFFPPIEDREHVYLYRLGEVSSEELLSLVEAQSLAPEDVWTRTIQKAAEYRYTEIPIPSLKPSEWTGFIMSKNPEELDTIASIVCNSICELCEEKKIERIIPAALSKVFGPDEQENKRAQMRSRMGDKEWYLTSNEHPWEMYFFERVDGLVAPAATDFAALKYIYINTLKEISEFAERVDSPFYEAFALSFYLLHGLAPQGDLGEKHLELIKKDLKKKKFSKRAIENFENSFVYYSEELLKMNRTEKIYDLLAVSLSDVFGGMGSWNDLYLETEADNNLYQELSADVFMQSKKYFAALLSS